MKIVNKKRFGTFIGVCFLIVLGMVYSYHYATEYRPPKETPMGVQVERIEHRNGETIYHFDNGKSEVFGNEVRQEGAIKNENV